MTEQEQAYLDLGYLPDMYPWLFPTLFPNYQDPALSVDPPTPEPDPVVIATPPQEQAPDASDPVQETSPVISLDELGQLLNQLQTADDESELSEELAVSEVPIDPGDVVAAELDPGTLAIIQAIKYVKDELIQIGDEVTEMQLSMDSHPMLTTPFENYTVTEGLLLLLLLAAFLSACARMLRGGLSWLRS